MDAKVRRKWQETANIRKKLSHAKFDTHSYLKNELHKSSI